MDLFEQLDKPEINSMAEERPFDWEAFKAGEPALTFTGEVAYYGGPCTHPMCLERFIAIVTVPDHAIIKYGKEVMPYIINEEGLFEGRSPFLVKMA
ncbi:hypothetical protein [Enterobacter sp. KB-221C9]|uniref:Uncharacterized protein n=1 Tax=Salmonella phage S144 TaxID=2759179 RepID=A0A7G5CEZ6_9CAUD|nr:hypothetical protein [Salmonella phage S144]WQZ00502.1 hypothetical protein AEV23_00058 [Klebsiella phage VB_KpM-AEV23]